MAGIVQSDPYQILCRKIGYSVGLESLVERIKKLVALYVENRGVSPAAFEELVAKDFNRKPAIEHFANFYGTLNLLRVLAWKSIGVFRENENEKPTRAPKALDSLYQLDVLSILRRLFENDDKKYEKAIRVVITQAILEADSDIFLNALISDFKIDEMKVRFENMVAVKRRLLSGEMPSQRKRINAIVNIKNESGSRSSYNDGAPKGRFERRTSSLADTRRATGLNSKIDETVSVSDDYLEKVRTSRKDWAEDLGWFQQSKKTPQGEMLIDGLEGGIISVVPPNETALFWGYNEELAKFRFKEIVGCERWDLLSAIITAYGGRDWKETAIDQNADQLLSLLQKIFELYKEGNVTQKLIRNSLPLYVAEPVLAGYGLVEKLNFGTISALLADESKANVRRVQMMIIRGTSGALFFSGQRNGSTSN